LYSIGEQMTKSLRPIYHAQRPVKPAEKPRPAGIVAFVLVALALLLFGVMR
jgi:hypothetical protein